MAQAAGVLIALGGLPGTGKSSIARELAVRHGAVHLRIDTIEQALRRAGLAVGPAGYVVAYALAEDNLRLGRMVIADSVNPLAVTREAWRASAYRAGARVVEVEVCCTDVAEHRHRIESRLPDIDGHVLPTWQDVVDRRYEPWTDEHIIIDTARLALDACVKMLDQPLRTVM
jgi:predicted kinase